MIELFKFLTLFDWITPSVGFFQDVTNDPTPLQTDSWTFFIDYDTALDAGWNPNDIESLLNKHGIKTWGAQYTYPQNEWLIRISRKQAEWAEYILLKNNVPISSKFIGGY